jgi:hypothetical protein
MTYGDKLQLLGMVNQFLEMWDCIGEKIAESGTDGEKQVYWELDDSQFAPPHTTRIIRKKLLGFAYKASEVKI